MSGVFISYRRKESKAHAHLIFRELRKAFPDQIFMDVDGLHPGDNFHQEIGHQLEKCTILLVIIGPEWVKIQDDSGNLRIHNDQDWVRTEISTSLQRNIRIIPILIDGATMPTANQLPLDIKKLSQLHALVLETDSALDQTLANLIKTLHIHISIDTTIKINEIRRNLFIAKSERDLHKILHEIELFLLTEPTSYEAKELKKQAMQAIENDINRSTNRYHINYERDTTPQTPWKLILIVAFIVAAALNLDKITNSVTSAINSIIRLK